jgi:hypothetical protein
MPEVLDPEGLLELIAEAVPQDLRPHLLVVGSVAAAYCFRSRILQRGINTKDTDVVIQPAGARSESELLARELLARGWSRIERCQPQPSREPLDRLEAIRLRPPMGPAFFLELLAFPERDQIEPKSWVPIQLDDGWYGLPSFRFLGLTLHDPQPPTPLGIVCAGPSMMALSNLLSHSTVGTVQVSEPLAGRRLLRSAKDLGRVLALARLSEREETEAWVGQWERALRDRFPMECSMLARHVGDGMRELLHTRAAMRDALHAVDHGLLARMEVTVEQLQAVGDQLIADAIDPIARRFEP